MWCLRTRRWPCLLPSRWTSSTCWCLVALSPRWSPRLWNIDASRAAASLRVPLPLAHRGGIPRVRHRYAHANSPSQGGASHIRVGAPFCDGVTDPGILELAPQSPALTCVSPPPASLSPCSSSLWCVPSRGGGRGPCASPSVRVCVPARRLCPCRRARTAARASMNLLGRRGSAARLDSGVWVLQQGRVVTCGYMWLHANHSESCTCRSRFFSR